MNNVGLLAILWVSAAADDRLALQLQNSFNLASNKIQKHLTFFTIEVGLLLEQKGSAFLQSPALADKKHYLEKLHRAHPYRLSEPEELLILDKDLTGGSSWQELASKWVATRSFLVNIQGEQKHISWSEAQSLFSHSNRAVRKEMIRTNGT